MIGFLVVSAVSIFILTAVVFMFRDVNNRLPSEIEQPCVPVPGDIGDMGPTGERGRPGQRVGLGVGVGKKDAKLRVA